MRFSSKTFIIFTVFLLLFFVFVKDAYAACKITAEGDCIGSCSCDSIGKCGSCDCKLSGSSCSPDRSTCYTCPTDTPKPPPGGGASPTPTPAKCRCQNGKCVGNLTKCYYKAVGCRTCSDPTKNADILEYCENDACNPPRQCAGYSASCASECKKGAPGCYAVPVEADCGYNAPGCNRCGYARVEAIYCNGVHCGDTCVPHALCSNSPWCSGGGNLTNTPALTATSSSVCNLFSSKKT